MKRLLIRYLLLCAIFEALLLLLARGTAWQNVMTGKYHEPERELPAITEMAPHLPIVGLIVPLSLIAVALAYGTARIESPKVGIHALGLSVILAVLVSAWAIIASFLPATGTLLYR